MYDFEVQYTRTLDTDVLRMQHRGIAEKSGLQDMKTANFILYQRRSRLNNRDKPKIFIKNNVKNHLCHQFYLVLAKIRINPGLLYCNYN